MKFINLFLITALSVTFNYAKEKVDCDDPKNTPRYIGGGVMIGGKMDCDVNRGTAERAKRDLDMTIGKIPLRAR